MLHVRYRLNMFGGKIDTEGRYDKNGATATIKTAKAAGSSNFSLRMRYRFSQY